MTTVNLLPQRLRAGAEGTLLVDPPLGAVTSFDRLIAAIENHDDTELKLKGIPSRKRAVEHIDGMVKGDVL